MGKFAMFDDVDTLSLLVAALCHDVGHDGFNNKFHVVTQSDRYFMYGDSNVQESYHVAETLKLLTMNEYNFVCDTLTPLEMQLFRKRIVECIINTDMAKMKNLREQLSEHMDTFGIANGHNSQKLIDTNSPKVIEESKQLVSNAIIHACDISTSLRDFDVSA